MSERQGKENTSEAWRVRTLGRIVALVAALLLSLTLTAAASADVSFTQAFGWGVLDAASQFESCTSTCQTGLYGGGAGQLALPDGIATDRSGDVYVADAINNRIDEFSAAGAFIEAYGWGVVDGISQFETCTSTCQGGPGGGGAGQLGAPVGVAVDPSGDVYVADAGNNRIDEFSSAGSFLKGYGWGVSDGASQFETCTSTCQTGVYGGGAGQFDTPWGVATDGAGDVYVADEINNRIDEFSPAGAFLKGYGWGVSDGASQFETCTSSCQAGVGGGGAGQLDAPVGVAVDPSGDVYVADGGNNRIDEFSAAGALIKAYGWGVSDGASQFETCTSTCQTGRYGGGAGEFYTPYGVATDSSGDVYVADTSTSRIDEFSAAGAFIKAYGWGVVGDGGQFETCTSTCHAGIAGGGAGQLYTPHGVATDSTGEIYVADPGNARIEEFGGAVAAHTLTQGPPASATVTDGAGFSGQLTVANANGTVSYTESTAAGSAEVVVTSTGAISAASTLASGTYTIGGSDSDTAGDTGRWTFSLTVTPAGGPSSAVPPPAQSICGAVASRAAHTASVLASSDAVTQCTESTVSESMTSENASADSAAETGAIFCMKAPATPQIPSGLHIDPIPQNHPVWEFICGVFNDVAVDDYRPSPPPPASSENAGTRLDRALATEIPNTDASFRVVFQPKPFIVPKLGTCPRLHGASCARLRTAELRYLGALANLASRSEAVGVTAHRFGSAKAAGDTSAESLQNLAEAKYLPSQASAVRKLKSAGSQLGTVLRSDHDNPALSAKQVAQGRLQLAKLDGIPRSQVTSLARDGLITNRQDLERIIASLLKKAPRAKAITLAQVLAM